MAAGDIRYTVRAAVVDALRDEAALTGVTVELGWPGDAVEPETIWLDSSDGDLDIPVFRGPPTQAVPIIVDDTFMIPVEVQAGRPSQTMDEAEARLQVMTRAVEHVVRVHPTLFNIDGLLWSKIAGMRGPLTVNTKQGAVSFARIEVECRARQTEVVA